MGSSPGEGSCPGVCHVLACDRIRLFLLSAFFLAYFLTGYCVLLCVMFGLSCDSTRFFLPSRRGIKERQHQVGLKFLITAQCS